VNDGISFCEGMPSKKRARESPVAVELAQLTDEQQTQKRERKRQRKLAKSATEATGDAPSNLSGAIITPHEANEKRSRKSAQTTVAPATAIAAASTPVPAGTMDLSAAGPTVPESYLQSGTPKLKDYARARADRRKKTKATRAAANDAAAEGTGPKHTGSFSTTERSVCQEVLRDYLSTKGLTESSEEFREYLDKGIGKNALLGKKFWKRYGDEVGMESRSMTWVWMV
jgi:hypothetical protein